MINRAAILLKAKQPFLDWINQADPEDDNPQLSLEELNEDRTVYLIDDLDAENPEEWIRLNHGQLFASELEDWYTDESFWPKERGLEAFYQWFAVECHSIVIDTVGTEIIDDET
jgi:hypothetical protein